MRGRSQLGVISRRGSNSVDTRSPRRPPLTIPMTGADESHTAGAGVRTSSRQALLCATPPRSKGARVARHAQGESSNAREQTAAVDKVVQDTVQNGMPTLAAAIIVTILTAMTAAQFWTAAPPLSARARAFVAVDAEQLHPAAPPRTSSKTRLPELAKPYEFAKPYADEAKWPQCVWPQYV